MARRKDWCVTKAVNYTVRRWLNPTHYVRTYHSQGGFIMTRLGARANRAYDMGASLRVADCSRSVNIELDIESPAARARSVKKLSILVDEISNLKAALERLEYVKR